MDLIGSAVPLSEQVFQERKKESLAEVQCPPFRLSPESMHACHQSILEKAFIAVKVS